GANGGRGGPRELWPRVAARGPRADMGGDSEGPGLAAPPRRAPTRSVERDTQSDGSGPVGLHDRRGVCKLSAELAAAVPPRHSGRDPACWHGSSAVRRGGVPASRARTPANAPSGRVSL